MSRVLYSKIKRFLPLRAVDDLSSLENLETSSFRDHSGDPAKTLEYPNVYSSNSFMGPSGSRPENPNTETSESFPGTSTYHSHSPSYAAAVAVSRTPTTSPIETSKSTSSTTESTSTATATSTQSSVTEHTATTTSMPVLPASATEPVSSNSNGGLPAKTIVAIVVPVVVGSLLLIAAAIFFILWWRRKKKNRNTNGEDEFDADVGMSQPMRGHDDVPYTGPIPRSPASQNYRFDAAPDRNAASEAESRRLMGATPQAPPPAAAAAGPAVAVDPPPEDTVTEAQPHTRSAPLTEENLAVLHRGNSREERPRSPFDDPQDDSVSAISDMERPVGIGGGGHGGRDVDEVSSAVSSLDDEHGSRRGSRVLGR